MESHILGIDDHIHACLKEAHPTVSRYSYPLFASDKYNRPDLFTSCVFLKLDSTCYLITAAHALYEIEKSGSRVHVGKVAIKTIQHGDIRSSKDGEDPLDIAAIPINTEFFESEEVSVLPLDRTIEGRAFEKPHMHCMHGYPCTKNKQYKAIDMSKKVFTTYALTYAGTVPSQIDFSKFKKDQDIHVCLNYSLGKDHTGKRVDPPKPKGMSGGGLWVIPNFFNGSNIFLKGILIEHHGKTVFATKIEKVIEFIRGNA